MQSPNPSAPLNCWRSWMSRASTHQTNSATEAGTPPSHPEEGWQARSPQGLAAWIGTKGYGSAAGIPWHLLLWAEWNWVHRCHWACHWAIEGWAIQRMVSMHCPTLGRWSAPTHSGDAWWQCHWAIPVSMVQCHGAGEEEGWVAPVLYWLLLP